MGGEQAANVLATVTKDQRAREGKEVMIHINLPICAWWSGSRELGWVAAKSINTMKDVFPSIRV